MNKTLLVLSVFVLSCITNVSATELKERPANSIESSCKEGGAFFPVFGFNIGETTEEELMVNGILGDNEKFYLIHGQAFWVKNGLFESMYLTTPREVPKVWRDIGFSWYLSYTQIYNLFECLGFEVNVNIEPQNEIFKGKESFKARLTAVNSLRNLKVTLNFLYGIGKDFNSENTLYSMKFVPIKKKGI